MRASIAAACTLLLGALLLVQAAAADEHEGTCPPVNQVESCDYKTEECTDDSKCLPSQKCCDSGCGKKCTDVVDLIAVCPAFDPLICASVKPASPDCSDDRNCTGGKKCCCRNCGLKCSEPVMVKPGRCPKNIEFCEVRKNDICSSDRDCPGDQKCCDKCGKVCRRPHSEPRGTCPKNGVIAPEGLSCPNVHCVKNSDCGMDEEICCPSGSGQTCVAPIREIKPGTCPPSPKKLCKRHTFACKKDEDCPNQRKCCLSGCNYQCEEPNGVISACPFFNPATCPFSKPGRSDCSTDGNCTDSKKCCCRNCGLSCTAPETVKFGRCPSYLVKCHPDYIVHTCNSDWDCKEEEKCCDKCGRKCLKSEPEPKGACPNIYVAPEGLSCPLMNCAKDSDCGMDEKCCAFENEQTCVKTSTDVRPLCPGSPIPYVPCKTFTNNCSSDAECRSGEHCCLDGCTYACQKIPDPRPLCPGSPIPYVPCPTLANNCSSNSDCRRGEQCCLDGCTYTCQKIPDKPGECPIPAVRCAKVKSPLCHYDHECKGDLKCCMPECVQKCTPPKPIKIFGLCPRTPKMPCLEENPKSECEIDSDCQPNQTCCPDVCGRKCKTL